MAIYPVVPDTHVSGAAQRHLQKTVEACTNVSGNQLVPTNPVSRQEL